MSIKSSEIAGLYQSERERLVRQVRRRVGSDSVASDLVQDLFLRFLEKAISWQGNPSAFLSRCARNLAIDHLRAEKTRLDFIDGLTQDYQPVAQPTPFETLSANDTAQTIDLALARLPKQTRHIFLLNRVHGRTFTEIAEVFGLSERSVAKHMARAIRACQLAVEDQL